MLKSQTKRNLFIYQTLLDAKEAQKMFRLFGHPVQSKVKGISQITHRHWSALISADAFQLAVYLEKTLAKSDQV